MPGDNTARNKLVQIPELSASAESNISVTPVLCSFKRDELVTFLVVSSASLFVACLKVIRSLKYPTCIFSIAERPVDPQTFPFSYSQMRV